MKVSQKTLGNVLIALSLFGFFIISLPFLLSHLPQSVKPIGNAYAIVIPKINASSPIVVGVDPWDQNKYKSALRYGVAQAKDTSLPGQRGMIYLFAHSSGNPWEILSTNVPFLRLDELKQGDLISLFAHGKKYEYKVVQKKIVSASDISVLTKNDVDLLILQTC